MKIITKKNARRIAEDLTKIFISNLGKVGYLLKEKDKLKMINDIERKLIK